jgi:hypothetical protein
MNSLSVSQTSSGGAQPGLFSTDEMPMLVRFVLTKVGNAVFVHRFESEGGEMSYYDDGRSEGPQGREPMSSYPARPGPLYGYSQHWEMRPRRIYPIETKPFFLTSEFVGAVLAVVGIAITAASSDAFGAWRAWILITAVAIGYMVSRGIAKSGTRSHADDPRERFDLSWGHGHESDARPGTPIEDGRTQPTQRI